MKKAECLRIDAFKLWLWRRFLTVPRTARSNQSILKEINPKYSMKELMLKLQYFGHLMQTANSLEKTLMLGKIEGRRRGQQMTRWLDGINGQEHGQTPGVGERQGSLACCSPWCHEKLDMTWQLKNTNKSHFLNLSIDLYSAFCL